jgi:hypothetical protein
MNGFPTFNTEPANFKAAYNGVIELDPDRLIFVCLVYRSEDGPRVVI